MPEAIRNTSPLVHLYRAGAVAYLGDLFPRVLVPSAVAEELAAGHAQGYDVPDPGNYSWVVATDPAHIPSEWLALDLGKGELATMALALERPEVIVLLDDALARRIAEAAGLPVWGSLRVLLEAKRAGLVQTVAPYVDRLQSSGMWLSEPVRRRILRLAGEQG